MNKVTAIAREIGKQPVLAFGNSRDDASMLNYAIYGNKYKSADKCRKLAAEYGWNVISMRDDFKTIYGDNVKRVTVSR